MLCGTPTALGTLLFRVRVSDSAMRYHQELVSLQMALRTVRVASFDG